MKYGRIYKIINQVNDKVYVGQTTKTIEERFEAHCTDRRKNRHLSNAINKYGKEFFKVELVAEAENQIELNTLEVEFVNSLNCLHPNGYNHRAGGNQNGICSDELKNKISKAKTGKPVLKRRGEIRSEEQRLKISRSLGGKEILATEISTGKSFILKMAHDGKKYGFNPSNIVSVCKGKRKDSKGYTFKYIENQANQSGSPEIKNTEHAQRLEVEPTKVE
jgi:group I intron endonuclease